MKEIYTISDDFSGCRTRLLVKHLHSCLTYSNIFHLSKTLIEYTMIFFFKQIREVFAKSHSTLQEIQLSRRAFFQLLGYLASCAVLSLASQSKYLH
ncbi:YJL127C-B [Zygosaccharomyces parabailii]|nr:YJL127C-B [Zygosaccharomyces parabailii]